MRLWESFLHLIHLSLSQQLHETELTEPEMTEMKETFPKTHQHLADRLVHLETTTREDAGKALQHRIGALELEISVQKPPAVQHAVQVPMPTGSGSFEQAFKEVQHRGARMAQLCISNLSLAEESTDTLQDLTEDFLRIEIQQTAKSQLSKASQARTAGQAS